MRKVFPFKNFPNKFFGVTAIFLLVALLLMLKPIASKFKDLLGMFGVVTTPEQVQETATDLALVAAGIILLFVGGVAAVFSVKIALIAAGVGIVAYSGYRVYQWVSSWPIFGKGADYGDTDLTKG
jgi:hypothetical protein